MKLSLYTFVRNGLHLDFHTVPMLKHHLPLADEIVVLEGYSTDGTYEAIRDIDPRIRIERAEWGRPGEFSWYTNFKDRARALCTGDWCLYLDCDEFLPDYDFARLRERLSSASEDLLPLEVVNFYGNYRVFHVNPEKVHWPGRKVAIHRNLPDVEFWGDGTNVRRHGQDYQWPPTRPYEFSCHHFGFVRRAARLREKWRKQGEMYRGKRGLPIPSFVFDLMPHRWEDPMYMPDLRIFDGPYIKAVLDDPAEFTRDGMATYRALQRAGR